MPYVPSKDRPSLDHIIDKAVDAIKELHDSYGYDAAFAGELNYFVTELALRLRKKLFGRIRYWHVALLSGIFSNIKEEFYRRAAAPYEDVQIDKNGDVSGYSPDSLEIK